ncbi:PAS domain S-box protein [Thiomicrorhabdus sp. ZW0627]|uniref:PAS domain S-box protein n=1 Tax=Thiomicrorhabdus sp. ZW0627 TaxID=3039774 RepID=UPI00243740B2|nr:PAS domain S-box protein [Thiomicrorhabdus sp. ZW0627]MDG6773152.1 PAS domain S-box protein [Thiomicrorhabdus sp. ZW0627]
MQKKAGANNFKPLYDVLFASSKDALILLDAETGKIIDCSKAATQQLSTASCNDIIGNTLAELSPEHQPDGSLSTEFTKKHLQQALTHDSDIFNWHFKTDHNNETSSQITLQGVDYDGKKCVLATLIPLKKTEYDEARLNAAQNLASLGSWEMDLITNKLWWSDEIFRIFEVDPKQFEASYDAFINVIHPDDRESVNQAYQDSIKNKTRYETDHRLLFPDGRVKYVHERGEHEFDSSGKPLRTLGTVQDITERKQMEILVQESEKKHRAIYEGALDGIVVANIETKQLIDGNAALCNMLGYNLDELRTLKVDDIHPQQDLPYVFEQFEKQARGEIALAAELPVQRKDGSVFYADVNSTPLITDDKPYILGVFRDVSERRQNQERFKLFRALLDQSGDSIEVLDPETLQFLDVNETECKELGYTREEMLSMSVFDIDAVFDKEKAKYVKKEVDETGKVHLETIHKRKDGSTFPVEVRASVVNLDKPYLISIARDITEQKEAQKKLRESELAYRTLTENLPGLVYRVLIQDNYHMEFYNDLTVEITGYTEEELTTGDICSIDPHILDEDRPKVLEEVDKAIVEKRSFAVEYRLKHKNGDILWMQEKGMPVFDEEGNLLYIDGMIFDITENKHNQESLRLSEEKFRALIESTSDWIWEVNPKGIYTYVSPQVETLLGYPPQEVIGKSPFDFMPNEERERVSKRFAKLAEKLKPINMLENTNVHKDGSLKIIETSAVPFFDDNGNFLGYRGVDRDITDRKRAEAQIKRMAHYDALTNLPNRALFLDRIKQELARAYRDASQFALLFIDLDHFKEINDTLGHDMGDLLLQQVAERLTGCVRQMDTVARIGGDEFTIILTELKSPSGAEHVAKKIIAAITEPFNLNQEKRNIGCSIGIAIYPSDGKDRETLLKHSDTAMYCAKKLRNTYHFYCNPALEPKGEEDEPAIAE